MDDTGGDAKFCGVAPFAQDAVGATLRRMTVSTERAGKSASTFAINFYLRTLVLLVKGTVNK